MAIKPILNDDIQKFIPGNNSSFYEVTICIEVPKKGDVYPPKWQWDALTNPYPSKVTHFETRNYEEALKLGLATDDQSPNCNLCNDTGFSLYPATGIAIEYIGHYIGYIPRHALLSSICFSCVDSCKPMSRAELENALYESFANSTYSKWQYTTVPHPETGQNVPIVYDASEHHGLTPKVDSFSGWVKEHKKDLLEHWF